MVMGMLLLSLIFLSKFCNVSMVFSNAFFVMNFLHSMLSLSIFRLRNYQSDFFWSKPIWNYEEWRPVFKFSWYFYLLSSVTICNKLLIQNAPQIWVLYHEIPILIEYICMYPTLYLASVWL
jgi:hypothetical protein